MENWGISIIVPAYKSANHIGKCLFTIQKWSYNFNVEILVGVDKCEETLNWLKNNLCLLKSNIRVFYFNENVGPYVIRNSLVLYSKYDDLMFFDADDVMGTQMIGSTLLTLKTYDSIRYKYYNFIDGTDYFDFKNLTINNDFSHGVFGVKKKVFYELNGFQPWRCGADSEFKERSLAQCYTCCNYEIPVFYRRLHGSNLTMNSDTGINSPLRQKYREIMQTKRVNNDWSNPDKLQIFDNIEIK